MEHKNSTYLSLLEAFRYGKTGKYLSIILVIAFLNTLGGCYYYKVVYSEDPPPEVINTQQEEARFFILHSGDQAWKFSEIHISDSTIVGIITPLQGHEYYKTTRPDRANRYKISKSQEKDEREVINEVHVTVSDYNAAEGNEITIALENIEKIEIYDKAEGATAASQLFSVLGILFGLLVSGFFIWLATDTSFS